MLVPCGTCSKAKSCAPQARGGLGYDPLFLPEGEERSMAEMSQDEKAAISHRGRATRHMAAMLGLA